MSQKNLSTKVTQLCYSSCFFGVSCISIFLVPSLKGKGVLVVVWSHSSRTSLFATTLSQNRSLGRGFRCWFSIENVTPDLTEDTLPVVAEGDKSFHKRIAVTKIGKFEIAKTSRIHLNSNDLSSTFQSGKLDVMSFLLKFEDGAEHFSFFLCCDLCYKHINNWSPEESSPFRRVEEPNYFSGSFLDALSLEFIFLCSLESQMMNTLLQSESTRSKHSVEKKVEMKLNFKTHYAVWMSTSNGNGIWRFPLGLLFYLSHLSSHCISIAKTFRRELLCI